MSTSSPGLFSRLRRPHPDSTFQYVPLPHVGRWISAVIVLALLLSYVWALVMNPAMRWDTFVEYLFAPTVLEGLRITVLLTVLSMAVGIALGAVLAAMRLSQNPVLSWTSALFVWFFRGVPLIVQLLFWYFLAALFPTLSIGIPFGPDFWTFDTNVLIGQFTAAVLALGLHEAAQMGEIYRAGIISVDHGQTEAAQAIGLSRSKILRRIILPQAMAFILPPTGNSTISMLKTTAIVLIIGVPDLLTSVQLIYARNFQQIPLLAVACFWYLLFVTVLSLLQSRLEKHYARGSKRGSSVAKGRSRRSALPAPVNSLIRTSIPDPARKA